ncbi:hypothetical protein FACS1894187_10430 [Synergistales bacterium]|nr:hypothetical protein FACS1894187_10430 [Synergistales bacterium]
MTTATATLERRETLYRRILELPDEGIKMVARYVEEIEEHEPNEETIAAMLEADELARQYSARFEFVSKS